MFWHICVCCRVLIAHEYQTSSHVCTLITHHLSRCEKWLVSRCLRGKVRCSDFKFQDVTVAMEWLQLCQKYSLRCLGWCVLAVCMLGHTHTNVLSFGLLRELNGSDAIALGG